MAKAAAGDTVRIHYTGTLSDGSVFDSSAGREPLEFTVGSGQVIPGFDRAVTGMEPGDTKTVTIAADDAYGQPDGALMLTVGRSEFPEGMSPEPGQQLQMSQAGQTYVVTVTEVTPESVVLDANHPLAGKDLRFELELVEIV